MAKPENEETLSEKQQKWGTWEELLLACAVNRHGTNSWDSVSVEIQNRSPNLPSLTGDCCREKYNDLKSRFSKEMALPESEISEVPWLEELRKLRVDELRRELEQYDLSISTLQSKVKKLEEEREGSLNVTETEIEKPDLEKIVTEKEEIRDEPVQNPAIQSVEDSISPDLKENSPGTGSENVKRDEEMIEMVKEEAKELVDGGEAKVMTGEDSCRGSCESVVKESAANSERVESGKGNELTESMAESKGREEVEEEEEEGKETSDVQSSASLPRKLTSEPENEDQSPNAIVESQPSISFVEILLSHPFGSHFSRRLETQETTEYSKIIREHVDFEIIRKRVEEGMYKSSISKLFRDLLLLTNNARVFYNKGSSEFKSAEQLNQLVKKQMITTLKKSKEEEFLKTVKGLKEAVPVSSKKPRMSVPIIACRKRSSLASKPLLLLPSGSEKKSDLVTEKDETSGKDDDEPLISRKVMKGRVSSTKMVAIRNVKSQDNVVDSKGVDKETTDEEKKGNGNSKKKSAVSFLKRMKVGSSSSDDTAVETVKPSSAADSSTSGKGGGAEQKKKADAKKRATTTPGKKQANEKGSPVKKNNGRVTKREASSSSPVLVKRNRESGEKETGSSSSTRSKKRVRR